MIRVYCNVRVFYVVVVSIALAENSTVIVLFDTVMVSMLDRKVFILEDLTTSRMVKVLTTEVNITLLVNLVLFVGFRQNQTFNSVMVIFGLRDDSFSKVYSNRFSLSMINVANSFTTDFIGVVYLKERFLKVGVSFVSGHVARSRFLILGIDLMVLKEHYRGSDGYGFRGEVCYKKSIINGVK